MHMDDLHVDPRLQPIPKGALVDKIALVTGASRGIGAVTARVLAQAGAQVILNYRSKGARAEKVAAEIKAAGGNASKIQCDITVSQEVDSMLDQIQKEFGFLDFLILNSSCGLEIDQGADYSMLLNCLAQVDFLKDGLPLLQRQC